MQYSEEVRCQTSLKPRYLIASSRLVDKTETAFAMSKALPTPPIPITASTSTPLLNAFLLDDFCEVGSEISQTIFTKLLQGQRIQQLNHYF